MGVDLTVTEVVYTVAGLHPDLPLPSVTVSEYTLVVVGVAVGFWAVADDRPAPLHVYTDAPLAGLAVRLTVPPAHIGPLLAGVAVGALFTVTEVVYIVDGAQPGWLLPSLTVREYTPVDAGVAAGFCAVDEDRLAPLHAYTVAPPAGLAVRFTVPPLQM